MCNLRATGDVKHLVRRVLAVGTSNDTTVEADVVLGGDGSQVVGNLLWVGVGVVTQEQSGGTSDVRGSHGGSGDGVDGGWGSDPGGLDGASWGEDVDTFTVVGERRAGIRSNTLGGGTDGDGIGGVSRGDVASILVLVTGGNNNDQTVSDSLVDGVSHGSGFATTQRQVGNSRKVAAGTVSGRPGDTLDDTGSRSRSVATQDLDGDQLGLLGNTPLGSTNSGGDVSSMTLAIIVDAVNGVGSP